MKTILRYAGGKSKAIKFISPHIPIGVKEIVSPFIGGGSLEVFMASELGMSVKSYDIFYHLVNFWQVLLSKKNEMLGILETLTPDKKCYSDVKETLLCWDKTQDLFKGYKTDHYKRTPIQLSDVEGAAYYFFNHQLSYGPMFLGWFSSIYNQKKYELLLKRLYNFNINNLSVEQKSFEDVISENNSSFLYLDPPYYLTGEGNKMFKGIYPNPNFDLHHKNFDHEKLRDMLNNHKAGFILSYNDCDTINDWYSDYDIYYPQWHYSYGAGETRIGKNKTDNNSKKSHEILIIKNSIDRD